MYEAPLETGLTYLLYFMLYLNHLPSKSISYIWIIIKSLSFKNINNIHNSNPKALVTSSVLPSFFYPKVDIQQLRSHVYEEKH